MDISVTERTDGLFNFHANGLDLDQLKEMKYQAELAKPNHRVKYRKLDEAIIKALSFIGSRRWIYKRKARA